MDKKMLTPAEVCQETVNIGVKKGAKSHFIQTCISGILAGAFIAMGGFAASVSSHSIANYGLSKLVAGAVFPVGLILVLICGAELFTGNNLLIVAFTERKITASQFLKNLIIVYFSNLLGAIIIAFMIFKAGLLSGNENLLGAYALKVAATKGSLSFSSALFSGILCNFLVCLAVWGSYAAKDIAGKVLITWFPIMAFIISGFEHSVANMYYFSIGMLAKTNSDIISVSKLTQEKLSHVNISSAISNLIPVTIGNLIGGIFFVGLAYWVIYNYAPGLLKSGKKDLSLNESK
ncbi:putative formate transporter 1 [Gottschalkia purinilytica]|uniref:Putative formate transporter 1 n=1 Tax=Gottschalkia purinilytica TaxID=1503 RepID=A0A0L0WEI7_GOTPU|nr:formate/nitrite transporter family protein [Gottschalkia purinilytica]KNF09893.1 putative formate transporter 1 [Gottschalkia purinilytica]